MNKKERQKLFDVILIIIILMIANLMIAILVPSCRKAESEIASRNCKINLTVLSDCCLLYHKDKQAWLHNQNWCDLIKPYTDKKANIFQCGNEEAGPCSYAMNENIPDDAKTLPDDLVVLFESKPGWNQVGGGDDVVTDRHGKDGANIGFADGHVEFVAGEDIPNLRWTIEEEDHD